MSEDTKQAFQSMKFYKFYPLPSTETPDVSGVKVRTKEKQKPVFFNYFKHARIEYGFVCFAPFCSRRSSTDTMERLIKSSDPEYLFLAASTEIKLRFNHRCSQKLFEFIYS